MGCYSALRIAFMFLLLLLCTENGEAVRFFSRVYDIFTSGGMWDIRFRESLRSLIQSGDPISVLGKFSLRLAGDHDDMAVNKLDEQTEVR